jgi:phenylalanyl-tRNA synthetase beta chain
MKISYNWLKRYADVELAPEETAQLLTSCGLEVESLEQFESVKGGLKGVVIGKVIECRRHPNADKLSLTKVDIGTGRLLDIVCGAPNVAAGQMVPVATVGALLYSGEKSFEIKEARIRGEFSEGMICAEDELGLGNSHEGIMVLDPAARIGMPAAEYFKVVTDDIFEIGLTPNRTDATSHTGVARDLVAVINQRLAGNKLSMRWPSVEEFRVDDQKLEIPVIVEDPEDCPRYSGLTMTGITIGESPSWLKDLLNAAGIRPINNVVDVTNFILMELGQPLHAFDAAEITGSKIVVRKACKDEPFVTLDGVERKLTADDLMICNAKNGMCIAGVFGGAVSGVTGKTTTIFLESAHFNPRCIRKTSRYHSLQTDASFRFERGSDPNITVYALKRAAMLIKEVAGGKISSEIVDFYPNPVSPSKINVTWKNIARLIGKEIDHHSIISVLADLGISIDDETPDGLHMLIPTYKTDVQREADVIEEILRIYGYDSIEMQERLRSSLSFAQKPDPEEVRNLVSDLLSGRGFNEIMNNSLTRSKYAEEASWLDSSEDVKLLNPLSSDLNVMRQTLLFGGLESIIFNINRKNPDLKFFEFGRVYKNSKESSDLSQPLSGYSENEHLAIWMTGRRQPENWRSGSDSIDFYDLKDSLMTVVTRLGFNQNELELTEHRDEIFQACMAISLKNNVICYFGSLSRKLLKSFDIKQEVMYADINWEQIMSFLKTNKVNYREIPKFPEVRRDLALVLDKSITYDELKQAAFHAEKHILRSVNLFDIYEGDKIGNGKKSYAISFVLRDDDKTLTDQVIEKTMEKILKTFQERFQAFIR